MAANCFQVVISFSSNVDKNKQENHWCDRQKVQSKPQVYLQRDYEEHSAQIWALFQHTTQKSAVQMENKLLNRVYHINNSFAAIKVR